MTSKTKFEDLPLAPNQWPLRFDRHSFGARSYNTQRSSIVYDGLEFGKAQYGYNGAVIDKPSPPPYAPDWKDDWSAGFLPGKTFAPPVAIRWTSLDGVDHEASIDLDAIFKDRLVLHRVAREDIPESWAADPLMAEILVEVNDLVINVYQRTFVNSKQERVPGNKNSRGRDDLMLAWTHTY